MKVNRVEAIDNHISVKNILVSVSDKRNLDLLINGLRTLPQETTIFSTGGTYTTIKEHIASTRSDDSTHSGRSSAGAMLTNTIRLVPVSTYTGQPEMQGGLVKTLDFKIYLGILSETYNISHQSDLKRTGAVPIDMVVVNLYPFKSVVGRKNTTPEEARGNIDIGGPCMLRAAAKNFIRVASICNPDDYSSIIQELTESGGKLSLKTRFHLAAKAFAHTADYDTAITEYFTTLTADRVASAYQFQSEVK